MPMPIRKAVRTRMGFSLRFHDAPGENVTSGLAFQSPAQTSVCDDAKSRLLARPVLIRAR
jgi:hypothetical protein